MRGTLHALAVVALALLLIGLWLTNPDYIPTTTQKGVAVLMVAATFGLLARTRSL